MANQSHSVELGIKVDNTNQLYGHNKTIRKMPSAASNRKLNEVNSQAIDFSHTLWLMT